MTKTIKKIIIGILILVVAWICFRVVVITYTLYQDGWRFSGNELQEIIGYIKYKLSEPKEEMTEVKLIENCQPEIDIKEKIVDPTKHSRELPYNKNQLKERAEKYLQQHARIALQKVKIMENLKLDEAYSDAGYWQVWRESMEMPSVLEIGISSFTGEVIYFKNCFKVSAK